MNRDSRENALRIAKERNFALQAKGDPRRWYVTDGGALQMETPAPPRRFDFGD